MSEPISASDRIDARLRKLFVATLEGWLFEANASAAPLGLHWCLFPPVAKTSELQSDGHAPRQHAVSVEEFPRRMWVGGVLDFQAPLPAEVALDRSTLLRPLERKQGRDGDLILTGFDHEYRADGRLLLSERQDIAFLGNPVSRSPASDQAVDSPGPPGDLCWPLAFSKTLLFRYSALTFNSHRIHYDADYAREQEGYRAVLVHGPLQATILLNLAASLLGRSPARFSYRAKAPLHAGTTARAVAWREGEEVRCAIRDEGGRTTMGASAC